MTGAEMKDIRYGLGDAIGRRLSLADMAKLCGLKEETYRKWEERDGPSGPAAVLLSLYRDGINSKWEIGGFMRDAILKRLDGEA